MASGLDEGRLRGLLAAARCLVTERDLARVTARLPLVSRELTGAAHAAVGVAERSGRTFRQVIAPDGELDVVRAAFGTLSAARELLEGAGPVRIGDLSGSALPAGLRSFLGVPVVIDGVVWGALCVADPQPDRFGPEDEQAMVALAEWAATAVQSALMHADSDHRRTELERSVNALEATFEIARAVGGETRMDRVLPLIADRARALARASGVFILLPAGPDFIVAAVAGHIPELLAGQVVPGGASVARRVLRTGQPERIRTDEMPSPSRLVLMQLGMKPKAALVVPLVFRGSNVGVIEALDRIDGPEFTLEDEHRLQAAAASAATAVATAQTVERERLHRSLQAAEQERGRWARELHDETLQGLGGLRMTLSSARRLSNADALRSALDAAVDQLGSEIADLRALITELRPASLDQLGLAPALDALFERATKVYGLPVRAVVALAGSGRLDSEVETAVYRVVQESLNNAIRHAGASVVAVEVRERGDEIHLRITDDGRGFDQAVPSAGFGLLGMRERATLAGGRLEIESGSEGTAVTAALPSRRAASGWDADTGGLLPSRQ